MNRRVTQGRRQQLARNVRRLFLVLAALLLLGSEYRVALAQDFLPGTEAELEQLNEHFGLAVYPYARRGAKPLGITGFEFYAELAIDDGLDGRSYGRLVDSLPGDLLVPIRVGIRKGLFGGFDIGASYTQVLDLDYEAFSVDLQKAIFDPGALEPGLALRLAYSDGDSGEVYSLQQYGVELIVSKGFTAVSVFGGAGLVRSEGDYSFAGVGAAGATEIGTSSTGTVLFAGVRLNLLLPKLTFAIEQTQEIQGVFRIAFGW